MKLSQMSVRTRFLLSYFLLFTLPLLVVGVVSYRRLARLVADKTEGAYQSILNDVTEGIDEQFRGLASFTQQLAQLTWMQKLMYMQEKIVGSDRVDMYTLDEYRQVFRVYDSANSFVDDIAVFFTGKDFYLSSRGKGDFSWLISFPFRVEGMDEPAWRSLLGGDNGHIILPSISLDTYGAKRTGLLYVQPLPSPAYAGNLVRATFIAFVSQGRLEEYLKVLHADQGTSAWITDAEGASLAGDPSSEWLARLAATGDRTGTPAVSARLVTDPAGGRFFFFRSVSALNGWRYYVAVPRQVILRPVDQASVVFAVLMVIFGIVGWFLSFGLAAMNYRPVSDLMQLMQGRAPAVRGGGSRDEFEWLQGSVRELLRQETELKQNLERDRPAATSLYLGKLLSGAAAPDAEYLKALELLGVRFPNDVFCCGVVFAASQAERVLDGIAAAAGPEIRLQPVDMGSHRAVIFNLRADAEMDELVDRINHEWTRGDREWASLGLGSQGAGIAHLSQSYREAVYAADYRLVWGSGIVVLFDAIRDADQCYYYPIGTENVMTNFLGAGERAQAMELLCEVMARNLERHGSSPTAIRNLALNIELTAAKAADGLGVGPELRLDTRRIQECDTIEGIRRYLDEIVSAVCGLARRSHHPAPGLDRVRVSALVDDNLTNPALSLKMLADSCGISPSYASRCFAEQFGCHFLDYVNNRRIEKAKVMLAEGSLSIGEVALRVGYASDVTFRRLFKSHEGFSPSRFQTLQKTRETASGRI